MKPSISPFPSSFQPSIDQPEQWVIRISKTFKTHLQVDTDLPVCIFQVPEYLISKNRVLYPKTRRFGTNAPFPHDFFSIQEQLKVTTAKTILTPYKIAFDFTNIVIQNLKQLVQEARCCYDSYFNVNDDTLAWVFALDGLFLINILLKLSQGDSLELFEDIMMVENQIPLIILIQIRTALEESSSGHCNNSFLSNLLVRICETRSHLKFNKRLSRLDLDIHNRFHLLDWMYHLIINHNAGAKNQRLLPNFLDDADLEDIENMVEMASGICTGANATLQHILIILKLPWNKIISLVQKMLGANPAVFEIDIPSISELSKVGKIEFCMTSGGIRDIQFDDETRTFYLPILNLKPGSEVILRNLVAYEGLMFNKGTFTTLHFTEYVDLMCRIIDSAKDVRVFREKHIIEGDLEDDEIVKLFNGISKSKLKTDDASLLQKTVASVYKYYGNVPRVKVYHFVKKYFLAWWKAIVLVFTLVNLNVTLYPTPTSVQRAKENCECAKYKV